MKGRSGTLGPENATPGVISIMYNGEPLAIPPGGNLPEITLSENEGAADTPLAGNSLSFTMELKIRKEWRCHSRKRFIKILMGKGFTRNQAAEIAEAVTWPHRYNLPRKYRPTYQGYLLNFMLDSALFAAVTIRKG